MSGLPYDVKALVEKARETALLSVETYYCPTASFRSGASVHQRGFEPVLQEQMVLQYAEKHGSIGRGEVAELCRLSPPQAYRLLKRLEKEGKIRQTSGSTKAVRYGSASK